MSLDNGEIIRRLSAIDPDPGLAFRKLCTAAGLCSMCCQTWDADGDCPCTRAAVNA